MLSTQAHATTPREDAAARTTTGEADAHAAAAERDAEARPARGTAGVVADTRLALVEPHRPVVRQGTRLPVFATSFAVHGVLLAILLISPEPAAMPQAQETSVEVIQEPAPDKKAAAAAAAEHKTAGIQQGAKSQDDRQTPAQRQTAETEQSKPPLPEPAKTDKTLVDKPKPAEPQQTKVLDPSPRPAAEDLAKLQALQAELASLKAEQAHLQTQAAVEEKQKAQEKQKEETKALGLLPDSFTAVILPNVTATGEDIVGYQQAIFSMIAKAKRKDLRYMPGVAHVVFEVDASGALVKAVIDHSSGNADVDQEALAVIHRASPFPPPPEGASRSFPAYLSFVADD